MYTATYAVTHSGPPTLSASDIATFNGLAVFTSGVVGAAVGAVAVVFAEDFARAVENGDQKYGPSLKSLALANGFRLGVGGTGAATAVLASSVIGTGTVIASCATAFFMSGGILVAVAMGGYIVYSAFKHASRKMEMTKLRDLVTNICAAEQTALETVVETVELVLKQLKHLTPMKGLQVLRQRAMYIAAQENETAKDQWKFVGPILTGLAKVELSLVNCPTSLHNIELLQ